VQLGRDALAAVTLMLVSEQLEVGLRDAGLDDQLTPDSGQPPVVQFRRKQAGPEAKAALKEDWLG
jgi:hypothetical protein